MNTTVIVRDPEILGGIPCFRGTRVPFQNLLDYLEAGNDNRRACSLYLSMMDRMGVKLGRFGDTDKRLPNLWSDAA